MLSRHCFLGPIIQDAGAVLWGVLEAAGRGEGTGVLCVGGVICRGDDLQAEMCLCVAGSVSSMPWARGRVGRLLVEALRLLPCVAQLVKNLPAVQDTLILSQEDPLGKG